MKQIGLFIFTLFLSIQSNSAAQLELGSKIPAVNVEMKGVDGKSHQLASLKGTHGSLVIFTCNECPWAKKWATRIRDISNTYKNKLAIIQINPNDATEYAGESLEEMKKVSERLKLEVPYVADNKSQVAKAFGATKTPEIFLFDKEGKLVYVGAVDDDANAAPSGVKNPWLKQAIDNLIAGKKIEPKQTKAIGCGIKFAG